MTDEQILQNYYSTVYESKEYKNYISAKKTISSSSMSINQSTSSVSFFNLLLIFSIYLSILLLLKFCFVFAPLIIIFPLIKMISENKFLKSSDVYYKNSINYYQNCYEKFNTLYNNTPFPPIPKDKLDPTSIKELLDVFASKRAETLKEALIIYEQDLQHRELVNKQRAMQQQIYSAQMAAAQAQKEAENAKQEAEYLRREEDYYRDQIYHLQQEDYWNNN